MAAGAATIATLSKILKTKYDQRKLYTLMYPDAAFLATIRKDQNFGGNDARITLRYGRPQGGSMVFSTAQANKTSSNDGAFLLTRAKDYHVCSISAEALLASKGNENAILDGVKAEMDGCTMMMKRSFSVQLYRNGGGARAQISAIATNVLTLTEPNDIVFFEVDMTLQFSAADGTSGSVRVGTTTITAVDRDNGKITLASAAAITGLAVSDYIFRNGDFGAAAKGLQAWLPTTAPTAGDNFFGQDRSVDTTRLAGVRFAATAGASKEDTVLDCASRLGREGGTPDAVYMHNFDRADIIKSLSSKTEYEVVNSTDNIPIGFKSLVLQGDKGPIKLISDPNCPRGKFFMLQADTWVIKSLGQLPQYANEDGNEMLRESNSDQYEWRMRALWQLGCEAPGFNANGTF
jgi:hypothetical protein